jgi:hypothetical protein
METERPENAPDEKPPAPLVRPKDWGSLLDRVSPKRGRPATSRYVSPMDCDWPANDEWGDGL